MKYINDFSSYTHNLHNLHFNRLLPFSYINAISFHFIFYFFCLLPTLRRDIVHMRMEKKENTTFISLTEEGKKN